LSSAAHKARAVAAAARLSGTRLDELISTIANAPDCATAARVLLEQLASEIGAQRAWIFLLDPQALTLDLTAIIGVDAESDTLSIPLADTHDPLIISTMTLVPVNAPPKVERQGPRGPWTALRLSHFVAVPLPQPQTGHAPAFLPLSELEHRVGKSYEVHPEAIGDATGRAGFSPYGVVVLEAECDTDTLLALFNAAMLAGPVIWRISVVEADERQDELERQVQYELKRFNVDLEARVRAATADLAEQNIRLQWQSRELEKANRLKSEFLANMSHELRTPINALIGYTSLMLDRIYGDITVRQEEGLTRIQGAAHHLLTLINDILDLAKIEAGRMPLRLDNVPLQDILQEINIQIDPLVKRKGLTYRFDVPSTPLSMYTDRTKVKQILVNLLSNAVKFTHTGGITLTATVVGEMVQIDVADTGIGIREEDLGAIWEDFRQVDQSRTREFGGTGLGLSITRKLAQALGGSVTLRSGYGTGSTFIVCLPLHTKLPKGRAIAYRSEDE